VKRRAGTVDIVGVPFAVYLADAKGEPLMATCYGICIPHKQQIVIDVESSREMRWLTLMHEGLHGIWAHAGLNDLIDGTTKKGREEVFIRSIAPHIVRFIASAERGVRI
jgi:hypothetical protein